MPLFQQSVVKKYLNDLDKEILQLRWAAFTAHFHNSTIQQNILNAKEEEYQICKQSLIPPHRNRCNGICAVLVNGRRNKNSGRLACRGRKQLVIPAPAGKK